MAGRLIALTACFSICAGLALVAQQRGPARVYLFTAAAKDNPPSDEERGRLDSLEDVRSALARRHRDFTLVPRAEDAQVTVELINREERESAPGGFGGKSVSRFRDTLVRLRVHGGSDESDLKGVGQGSWKSAANDAAERLAKWVKNHGLKH
jgi:hypothetical protein